MAPYKNNNQKDTSGLINWLLLLCTDCTNFLMWRVFKLNLFFNSLLFDLTIFYLVTLGLDQYISFLVEFCLNVSFPLCVDLNI